MNKAVQLKEGDWVTIEINGEDIPARIRAIMGKYCKLELTKYVHLDGHRTRVYVAKMKDVWRV